MYMSDRCVLCGDSLATELAATFDDGDVVASPDGKGVVAAEMRSDFRFPTGPKEDDGDSDSNTVEVSADEDTPAYVVGFGGESAVYQASDLDSSRFIDDDEDVEDEPPETTDGDAITPMVGEVDVDEDSLPDGWDTQSLLDFWASIGGSVDEAVNALQDERGFDEDSATRMAARMKDMVVGTERWRNRF